MPVSPSCSPSSTDQRLLKHLTLASPFHESHNIFKSIHSFWRSRQKKKKEDETPTKLDSVSLGREDSPLGRKLIDTYVVSPDELVLASPTAGKTTTVQRQPSIKKKYKQRNSLRRIYSMSASNKELNNQYEDNIQPTLAFQSLLDKSTIPYHYDESSSTDHFPRISAATLKDIIENESFKPFYQNYYIIDCRFEYEFKGGHIQNALNFSSRSDLEAAFIDDLEHKCPALLIFHCEFSSYRSPLMASHLRNCDRMVNHDKYPDLCYPDILILEGGYQQFFQQFPNLCYPSNYIGMNSQENLQTYKEEMDRFRKDSKQMVSRSSSNSRFSYASNFHRSNSRVSRHSSKSQYPENSNNINTSSNSLFFKYDPPPKLNLSKLEIHSNNSSPTSRLSFSSESSNSKVGLPSSSIFESNSFLEERDELASTTRDNSETPFVLPETPTISPKRNLFAQHLSKEKGKGK